MVTTENLTISSLDTMHGYNNAGDLVFTMDEMQDCTISNTEEKVDITGRGGRKLSSLKRNKAVTISGTNGLFSGDLLAVQTGTDIVSDTTASVDWIEIVTVSGNAATIEFKPIGVAGAEVKAYVQNENGTRGIALTQVASASELNEHNFTYANKTLSFHEGDFANGTQIIVCYTRKLASAAVVSNISDTYSQTVRMTIDATAKDTCDNIYHVQFQIPRADFSGNFDIQMGGDQMVQNFEAESLSASGACGATIANKGKFWDMVIFGEDTADAE